VSEIQTSTDQNQRRARALRTVWMLAAIAVAIYVGFILRGVLGK
jgi:predicted nucleic acid-binding Zn ribbon protein